MGIKKLWENKCPPTTFMHVMILRFGSAAAEIHRQLIRLNLNRTKIRLIFLDIVLKSTEKPHCMFGSQYYPRLHLRLRHTRHYPYKVKYKFRRRVSYHCKICIGTLCYRLVQFNIQLVGVLCHSYSI